MVHFQHRAAPERVHINHKRQRGATSSAKAAPTRAKVPVKKTPTPSPPAKTTAKDAVKTPSAPAKTSSPPPAKATIIVPSTTSAAPSVPSPSPTSSPATSTHAATKPSATITSTPSHTNSHPNPSASSDNSTANTGSTRTSPAVIGLVVALVCLVLFMLAGFFVRKWFIRRRRMRRNTWGAGIIPTIEEKRRTMYEDDPNARLSNVPATQNKPLPPQPGFGSAPPSPSPFSSYNPYGGNSLPSTHPYPPVIAAPPVARNGHPSPPSSVTDHSQHSYGSQAPTKGPYLNPTSDMILTPGAPPVLATPTSAVSPVAAMRTIATVARTFIPTLPDELSITNGETVTIEMSYDDGWALCTNQRGEQGAVPLECLVVQGQNTQASTGLLQVISPVTADFSTQEKSGTGHWRLSRRASSLYGASNSGSQGMY